MTATTKQPHGGRAFHSILAPHFEFIRELRKQRKTWKEIAELLHREKGVRVTLYAPYFFCKRRLKRMTRPHWEDEGILNFNGTRLGHHLAGRRPQLGQKRDTLGEGDYMATVSGVRCAQGIARPFAPCAPP